MVKRKDLSAWENEFGGNTAEGIAKRIINKLTPARDELSIDFQTIVGPLTSTAHERNVSVDMIPPGEPHDSFSPRFELVDIESFTIQTMER